MFSKYYFKKAFTKPSILEDQRSGRQEVRPVKKIFPPFLGRVRVGINQYPSQPPLIRGGNVHNDNISEIPQKPQPDNSYASMHPGIYASKVAFTLAEGATHVGTWKDKSRVAFTLAEVLITLAIIGVVAAMTLPLLVQNHKRKVVSGKLKNFYTVMKQAEERYSFDEFGDKAVWERIARDNFSKIAKYINSREIYINFNNHKHPIYIFNDGSAIIPSTNVLDYFPYAKDIEKCVIEPEVVSGKCIGTKLFRFAYYSDTGLSPIESPFHNNTEWHKHPEFWSSLNKYERACHKDNSPVVAVGIGDAAPYFCTKVLQLNNWEFPKDYPFKL